MDKNDYWFAMAIQVVLLFFVIDSFALLGLVHTLWSTILLILQWLTLALMLIKWYPHLKEANRKRRKE